MTNLPFHAVKPLPSPKLRIIMNSKKLFPALLAAFALWSLPACTEGESANGVERSPIAKSDSVGSCQASDDTNFCGDQSDSNCFCDDNCDFYGDCCSDKLTVCATEFDSCADLECGDSCTICDPADVDCLETALLKQCQSDGICAATVAECTGSSEPEENFGDCDVLACGDLCSVCDPTDPDCVESQEIKVCQVDGTCTGEAPTCSPDIGNWDACADLECGDLCTLCAPDDLNCVETSVLKACSDDGVCSATAPTCSL